MKKLWFVWVALLMGGLGASAQAQAPLRWERSAGNDAAVEAAVEVLASHMEPWARLRVTIRLSDPKGLRGEARPTPTQIERWQDAVLRELGEPEVFARFRHIPYLSLAVTLEELGRLRALPIVTGILQEKPVPAESPNVERLDAAILSATAVPGSRERIGADIAWAAGVTGAHQEIAVLDTGVDVDHPMFAGRTIRGACFSSTSSEFGFTWESLCPNGGDEEIGVDAGKPCVGSACGHGTSSASVALGVDAASGIRGVAPEADLYSVQVFSRFTEGCGGSSPCTLSWYSDHVRALDHVYDLVVNEGRSIAAATIGFGGGVYEELCDDDPSLSPFAMKEAVDMLLEAGVVTTVPAGNGSGRGATGYPGCISSAVTVSGTTLADELWSRSDIAPWVDVLAPSTGVQVALSGGSFGTSQGTSFAAPHVAGAWALLRQRYPSMSPADLLAVVRSTGVPIAVGSPAVEYPRLQVDAAMGGAPSASLTPEAGLQIYVVEGETVSQALLVGNAAAAAALPLGWTVAASGGAGWLSLDVEEGLTEPDAEDAVTVGVDASALAPGTYTATLTVETNDPDARTGSVPVSLEVLPVGTALLSGAAGWRLMGAPAEVTVLDLAGLNLVAGIPGLYPTFYPSQPNLYTTSDGSDWIPATGAEETIPLGQGFFWYAYNEAFTPDVATTHASESRVLPVPLVAPGPPNTSDVSRTLNTTGRRFTVMSNPFSEPLDLGSMPTWSGGGRLAFRGRGYVWNPVTSGWELGPSRLEPWQGFVVRAKSGGGTLTIPASAVISSEKGTAVPDQAEPALFIEVEGRDARSGRTLQDRSTALAFGASEGDAEELEPLAEAFVALGIVGEREGQPVLNDRVAVKAEAGTVTVPISVRAVGAAPSLTLRWRGLDTLPETWTLTLRDRETGETIDLRQRPSVTFRARTEPARARRETPALTVAAPSAPRFDLVVTMEEGAARPALSLDAPTPNPVRTAAALAFHLPRAAEASLIVADVRGREVARLAEGWHEAGSHEVRWETGSLAPGVYVVRLASGESAQTRRVVVVR